MHPHATAFQGKIKMDAKDLKAIAEAANERNCRVMLDRYGFEIVTAERINGRYFEMLKVITYTEADAMVLPLPAFVSRMDECRASMERARKEATK
jgi:hypothetical protein